MSIALGGFFGMQSDKILADVQNNPTAQSIGIDYMVRTQGVEDTLKALVRDSQTPVVVDEVTTLTSVESDGNRMRRTYVVDFEDISLSRGFWYGIEKTFVLMFHFHCSCVREQLSKKSMSKRMDL